MKIKGTTMLLLIAICISAATLIVTLQQKESKQFFMEEKELLKGEKFLIDLYNKENLGEGIINDNIHLSKESNDKIASTNEPVFIFRYSAFSCNSCIDFGNVKIKELMYDINAIAVTSGFPVDRKISSPIKLLNLGKFKLGIPIEETNIPFYCVLIDSNIQHVFIPDAKFPEYVDIYLKEIKKRYF